MLEINPNYEILVLDSDKIKRDLFSISLVDM